jgi:hypothetical protein
MKADESYLKAYCALDQMFNKGRSWHMSRSRRSKLLETAYQAYADLAGPGSVGREEFLELVNAYENLVPSPHVDVDLFLRTGLNVQIGAGSGQSGSTGGSNGRGQKKRIAP